MNIHNVHVNRMPLDGVIKNIVHLKGSHVPAFRKDSDRNERVVITIDTGIGMLKICQIAGTLARRITPYIKKDDSIRKGTRIGIIKLGSRVDLYLPLSSRIKINIKEGDKVKAGEDTIAKIHG
ncbi:MAG: phosphatidylserine decarboxylase family protein, partial [Thermoplasmata archaeon]